MLIPNCNTGQLFWQVEKPVSKPFETPGKVQFTRFVEDTPEVLKAYLDRTSGVGGP
jgi:hypothetical protein